MIWYSLLSPLLCIPFFPPNVWKDICVCLLEPQEYHSYQKALKIIIKKPSSLWLIEEFIFMDYLFKQWNLSPHQHPHSCLSPHVCCRLWVSSVLLSLLSKTPAALRSWSPPLCWQAQHVPAWNHSLPIQWQWVCGAWGGRLESGVSDIFTTDFIILTHALS